MKLTSGIPIICRRDIENGFKCFAEIHGGIKSAVQGDFGDAFGGIMQQSAGHLDFQDINILDNGVSGQFLKCAA